MSTCCIVRWRRCGSGENIDWRRFNQTALGKHIPLPDYPFEQTYYYRYGAALSGYRQYPNPLRRPQDEWLQRVLWRMHDTSLREAFYAPGELIIIISADGDKLQQTLMSSGVDSITMPLPISSEDDVWDNDRILTHFRHLRTFSTQNLPTVTLLVCSRCGGRIIVDAVALGTLSCCSLVYAQHHAAGVLNSIDPWCVSRTGRG